MGRRFSASALAMVWQGIHGHDAVVEQFRRALVRGRLASSYLLIGPNGVGKRTFAERLAQTLLCTDHQAQEMNPCGRCSSCQQVIAGTHPDLEYVCLPPGRKSIPVERFIGDRDHRGQAGLCHSLAMKPFMGGYKVGLIDDADSLNEEGANCLLKTLEEPPPRSILLLIGTNPDRQLPTIRSRCQIVRFRPLDEDLIVQLLCGSGVIDDRDAAIRTARHSRGSLTRAVELASEDYWMFREQFVEQLANIPFDSVRLTKAATAFVDGAGKENADRRRRAVQVVEIAIEFYGRLLRSVLVQGRTISGDATKDDSVDRAVERFAAGSRAGHGETVLSIDRCLQSLVHIDRNAHVVNVLSCWLDDLQRLAAA